MLFLCVIVLSVFVGIVGYFIKVNENSSPYGRKYERRGYEVDQEEKEAGWGCGIQFFVIFGIIVFGLAILIALFKSC